MKKIVVVLFLIILGLSIFIFNRVKGQKTKTDIPISPTSLAVLPTIDSTVEVELKSKPGNKVELKIAGLTEGLESIDYELTYLTGSGLPRGILGKIKLKGETEIVRSDLVLGTCSSGRCVYDTGVKTIDLSLKFNSPSKSSIFKRTFEF